MPPFDTIWEILKFTHFGGPFLGTIKTILTLHGSVEKFPLKTFPYYIDCTVLTNLAFVVPI